MTKILLVEDDKSLREIYGVRLLAEGYDIVSAGDGEEAIAVAIKDRPSLIVSDVMMPKISGFDMLDILRSTTETRDIKVIMMTALSSEDQRKRGEQLGADRYLVKSQVGIEDVVRTVHEVLGDTTADEPSAPPIAAPSPTPEPTPAPAAEPVAAPTPDSEPATTPAEPVAAPTTDEPARPISVPSRDSEPVQPTTEPAVAVAPPAPEPVNPVAPEPTAAPAPTSDPSPVAQAPVDTESSVPTPSDSSGESNLPQPTAPFSTSRPGNLASRVIQPISKPAEDGSPHVSDLMDRELSGEKQEEDDMAASLEQAQQATASTLPAEEPVALAEATPATPVESQPAQPQVDAPAPFQPGNPASSGLQFEEPSQPSVPPAPNLPPPPFPPTPPQNPSAS